MASTNKVDLSIIINSFEAISTQNLFGISDVAWKDNVPFAVGGAVDSKFSDTVQGLLGNTTVQVALVGVGYVDQ